MTNFLSGLALGTFEIEMPHVWFLKNNEYLKITNVVYTEWILVAVLLILGIVINRALVGGKKTGLRSAFELLVDFLEGWFSSFIGGRKNARRFMPLLGSLFLFILFANYSGLIPTAGSPGSIFAPTSRWGTTLGLAIVVAIACQYVAIVELGLWGWVKHLLHLGPLSVLEEFVRPFSLSLRLFGNIFGEETLLAVIVFLAPYFAPIPIMGLSLLFGAIQAIVFTTLTSIYIGGILEHAEHVKHEAHLHGHGHEESHAPEAAHAH